MNSKIDASLLEIIQQEAKKAAQNVYATEGTRYGVADVPTHTHNNIDTGSVPASSVTGFVPLPAQLGDMLSPDTLGSQVVVQGNTTKSYGNNTAVGQATFPIYPVPIIYGGGSSTAYTLTGTPAAGATSATLTAPYAGTTGTYATAFSSTEIKNVNFTNGSANISWSSGLELPGGGTGISLNGASVFQGGDAPLGTMVIFSAELSLTPQLWIRVDQGAVAAKWWGIDFTTGIWGLTA